MDIFSMDRFGRSIINADESVRLPIIPIHFSPDLLKTVLPFQMLTRYSTWLIIIVFLGFIFTGCGGGIKDDTEAPDSPIIAALPQITINSSAIDINGIAEAGTTIDVFDSDGTTKLGSAVVGDDGKWSLSIDALSEGEHRITAIATDAAGNTSAVSGTLTVIVNTQVAIDTSVPIQPVILYPADGALLNVAGINFSGFAEADSSLTLYDADGKVIGIAVVDINGVWDVSTTLSEGAHKINAHILDGRGKESESTPVNIFVDTITPSWKQRLPASEVSDIAPDVVITVEYNEALSNDSVENNSITLVRKSDNAPVAGKVGLINDGKTLTFTPTKRLEWGVAYTVKTSGTFSDAAGNTPLSIFWNFTTQAPPAVEPLYSNAINWNDYVKATNTGTACDGSETGGYAACVHGGEKRVVSIPTYTSCTGLTAIDTLGVFDWSCDDSVSPVRMVSNGLKDKSATVGTADASATAKLISLAAQFVTDGVEPGDIVVNTTSFKTTSVTNVGGEYWLELADDIFVAGDTYTINTDKNLSDLINFDSTSWKQNAVTVKDGDAVVFTTASSQWWSNSFYVDNDGGVLSTEGAIFLVTNETNADYNLIGNKLGLVVKPGVVHKSSTFGSSVYVEQSNFIWLEGFFDATGQEEGVGTYNVKFLVLRNVVSNNADYNLAIGYSDNNLLTNIVANNITSVGMSNGVYLNRVNYTTINDVIAAGNPDGITFDNSTYNTLTNILIANNSRYGVWMFGASDNNSFVNLTVRNNGLDGISITNSANNILSDIHASDNPYGISISASSNNTIANATISNSPDEGLRIYGLSSGNKVTDISVTNSAYGISLFDTSQNTLDGALVDWNNIGISVSNSTDNTLSNVVAHNNDSAGIRFDSASGNTVKDSEFQYTVSSGVEIVNSDENTFTNITSSNNSFSGFFISSSSNNRFTSIRADENSNYGIYLIAGSHNLLSDIKAALNSEAVFLSATSVNKLYDITAIYNEGGLSLTDTSRYNVLSNLVIANNDLGIRVDSFSSKNQLANVTSVNNAENGIELNFTTESNSLHNVTAANNGGMGVYLDNTSYNSVSNITTTNNGTYGLILATSSNNSLQNIASANNNGTGISIGNSSNNYFTGQLLVGNNAIDCVVSGGPNPGLDVDCNNSGSSDASLTKDVSLGASFVGKIAGDDSMNNSDVDGGAEFPTDLFTFDWTSYENNYRAWGPAGGFPGADSRGLWIMDTGHIWDWSVDSTDTVINRILAVPDGSATITHTWNDLSTTTYLRNAQELLGDLVGNDNGFCETGEVCLYTPNIASYQGHLESPADNCSVQHMSGLCEIGDIGAGFFLLEYDANGY